MLLWLARLFRPKKRQHIGVLIGAAFLSCLGGALAFSATQGVSFGTAMYWALETATTVGYGDVIPHNATGKWIAAGVMLTAIPLLGAAFGVWASSLASADLRRILRVAERFPEEGFLLVVGVDGLVNQMLDDLVAAGERLVLVAQVEPEAVPEGVFVVRGDPKDASVVRRAKPAMASHALVTGSDDGEVLVSVLILRSEAPRVPISALVRSQATAGALGELGISHVISTDQLLARALATSMETPHAVDLLGQLVDPRRQKLVEVPAGKEHVGMRLSELRKVHDGLVLALIKGDEVILGVERDPVVESSDLLLVAHKPSHHEVHP